MSDQAGILAITLIENRSVVLTYATETIVSAYTTAGDEISLTNCEKPNFEININSGGNRNNLFDNVISFVFTDNNEITQNLLDQITDSIYGWLALIEMYNGNKWFITDPLFNLNQQDFNSAISHLFNLTLQHEVDSNILPFIYAQAAPTITTVDVSDILDTTATSGGTSINDNGSSITAKGVCWSTSPNPTIADSTTTDGSGTGVFTSSLTSLTASTTYYVRAYATNSAGTGYGSEVSFLTVASYPVVLDDGSLFNSSSSNIEVKEIIIRKIADSPTDEQAIYDYLALKYSIV